MDNAFVGFKETSYWPQFKKLMGEICDEMARQCLNESGERAEKVVASQREHKGARLLYTRVVAAVEAREEPAESGDGFEIMKLNKKAIEGFMYEQVRGV